MLSIKGELDRIKGQCPFNPHHAPFLAILLTMRKTRILVSSKFAWMEAGEEERYNLTEVFRTPLDPSRSEGEKEWARDEHARDIEYCLFNGARFSRMVGGVEQTYNGGIQFFVKPKGATKQLPPGLLGGKRDDLLDSPAWEYGAGGRMAGTKTKYLFVPTPYATTYALYETFDDCRLVVVGCQSLNTGTNSLLAFLVDMNHARLAVREGDRCFRYSEQKNGMGEFFSEVGLELTHPSAHDVFTLSERTV